MLPGGPNFVRPCSKSLQFLGNFKELNCLLPRAGDTATLCKIMLYFTVLLACRRPFAVFLWKHIMAFTAVGTGTSSDSRGRGVQSASPTVRLTRVSTLNPAYTQTQACPVPAMHPSVCRIEHVSFTRLCPLCASQQCAAAMQCSNE